MNEERRDSWSYVLWSFVTVCFAAGILVRWVGLLEDSFWQDEVVTFELARYSWVQLFQGISLWDTHPPLFASIAKLMFSIFGATHLSARALSAFIGSLSLVVIFLLGKSYGGFRTAIGATLIGAFHHFAIYYSREFRSYILLFALTGASFLLCRKWFLRQAVRSVDFVLLILINTLLLYTHYYAFLVMVFENFIYLFCVTERQGKSNRLWWLANAASLAFYGLWIPGFANHAFELTQIHLGENVNLHELVAGLSPLAASMRTEGVPFLLKAMAWAFPIIFLFGLGRLVFFRSFAKNFKYSMLSLKSADFSRATFYWFGLIYLFGLLLAVLSYYPFLSVSKFSHFDWPDLAMKGCLVYSIAFACIVLAFFVSVVLKVESLKIRDIETEWFAFLIFIIFPVFAVLSVQIESVLFKPSYSLRNFIFILPSFICGVAWLFGKLKNRFAWFLILLLLFALFSVEVGKARMFAPKVDVRGIARVIEQESGRMRVKIPVVVLSVPAHITMRHFLGDYRIINGKKDVEGKLKKAGYAFWVWHDPDFPPRHLEELIARPILYRHLKNYPVFFMAKRRGMLAALLKYSD